MSNFPAVPLPVAIPRGRKRRAGLPRLLHKLFFSVLRLRPALAERSTPFEAYYEYRMVDECYYSYSGLGVSSWPGVLTSIPEESSEEGSPDVGPSVLRKAQSERFVDAEATMVHLEVVLCDN